MKYIPKMFLTISIPVDWRMVLKSKAIEEDVSIAEIIRRAIEEKYIKKDQNLSESTIMFIYCLFDRET